MLNTPMPCRAFTCKYDGLVSQLKNKVQVLHEDNEITEDALWDTGATITCISKAVAEKLSLVPTGVRLIKTPSGAKNVPTYLIDIKLPNNVIIKDIEVCGSDIGDQGLGVLVGMNIIMLGDFSVSSYGGKTTFTFRIPSMEATDFVKKIKLQNLVGKPHGPGKRKKKNK